MSPGNHHNSPWIQRRTCWSYSHTATRCRDGVTALLLLLAYNTHTGNGNATEKHREKWSLPHCASPHPGSHSAGRWTKPFRRVGMDELCAAKPGAGISLPPPKPGLFHLFGMFGMNTRTCGKYEMGKGGETPNQGEFGMDQDFWFSELQSPASQALSKAQHSNLTFSRGKRGRGCLEPPEQPLSHDVTLPKE